MRTPPAWHAEAREMRDQGMTYKAIGAALGRKRETVSDVLEGRREQKLENTRRFRAKVELAEAQKFAATAKKMATKPDTMEIARLFAAGQIDRAELSRRLRGEARP